MYTWTSFLLTFEVGQGWSLFLCNYYGTLYILIRLSWEQFDSPDSKSNSMSRKNCMKCLDGFIYESKGKVELSSTWCPFGSCLVEWMKRRSRSGKFTFTALSDSVHPEGWVSKKLPFRLHSLIQCPKKSGKWEEELWVEYSFLFNAKNPNSLSILHSHDKFRTRLEKHEWTRTYTWERDFPPIRFIFNYVLKTFKAQ